ncbi:hypothetical protein Tco_0056311 [Tanacetum coccineum]
MNRSFIARSGYRLERETFSCHSCRLTLSVDLLQKALNVTPADSAHPFELPLAGKTDITFTRRRVPSNWLMKMKFNRLLNLIWMMMSTIYNEVGSNSEQSYVALAGPNPEHMHDVFLATNYPKVHVSSMMTPGQLNSGLAPSHVPATTNIPPTDKDLEILFQPMFDE